MRISNERLKQLVAAYYDPPSEYVVTSTLASTLAALVYDLDDARAEIERLRVIEDNYRWLLEQNYRRENPDLPVPDFQMMAMVLREAEKGEGTHGGRMTEQDVQKIKAELFDLQYHNCNGVLSIPPQPGDHGCTMCARNIVLSNQLQQAAEAAGGDA